MPRLLVERGNEKGAYFDMGVEAAVFVVGRSMSNALVVSDTLCSRAHFQIEFADEIFTIQDLDSHNGTFLNGKRISEEMLVLYGDTVRAGETLFAFLEEGGAEHGKFTGKRLDNYDIQERLGVGGMGEVYKANQRGLGRTVALKILHEDLVHDEEFVERFLSEARAAGKLNHPNVIQVHEVGQSDGVYFFSMEYVSGGSVHDLVRKARRLPPERCVEIAIEAARALDYAEKQGIVHCDIKPDNLMLTEEGEVRVADLGIARRLTGGRAVEQIGGVFGSPHFMAPEQARGEAIDHRVDLYSLGATFYRILAGRTPFTGRDAQEIMEKQVYDDPEPIRDVVPEVSPRLAKIVETLMEKQCEDRYQTADELIEDLEAVRGKATGGGARTSGPHGPVSGRRARSRRERGGSGAVLVVVSVLILVVGLIVLIARMGRGTPSAAELKQQADKARKAGETDRALELLRKARAGATNLKLRESIQYDIEYIADQRRSAKREQDALDALKQLQDHIAQHPGDTRGILARIDERLKEHRESSVYPHFRKLRADYRAKFGREADEAFKARRRAVKTVLDEYRYRDAVERWDEFAAQFQDTGAARRAAEQATQVRRKGLEDVKQLRAEAARRIAARDFKGAERLIEQVVRNAGIREIVDAAREVRSKVRADIRAARRKQEEDERTHAVRRAREKLEEADSALRGYRYAHAVRSLREARRLAGVGRKPDAVPDQTRRIEYIQSQAVLFERILVEIQKLRLVDLSVQLGGAAEHNILRATPDEVHVRKIGGDRAERMLPWAAIHPEDVLKLFRQTGLSPDEMVDLGHFCSDHGLVSEARKIWRDAMRVRRSRRAEIERLVNRLPATGAGVRRAHDVADARHYHEKARTLIAAGDGDEAKKWLGVLQSRYGGLPEARAWVKQIKMEIEQLRLRRIENREKAEKIGQIPLTVNYLVMGSTIQPLQRVGRRKDLVGRGDIYLAMGKPAAARRAYELAARTQADSYWVQSGTIHLRIARTYALEGQAAQARTAVARAREAPKAGELGSALTDMDGEIARLGELLLRSQELLRAIQKSPADADKHYQALLYHSTEFPVPMVARIQAERLRQVFTRHPKVLDGAVDWHILLHRWQLRNVQGLANALSRFQKRYPATAKAHAGRIGLIKADIAYDQERWQAALDGYSTFRKASRADIFVRSGEAERRIAECKRKK